MKTNKKKSNNNVEQLFLLTKKAIPDVMISVLKVKDLIEKNNFSVANATNKIGISRTTYYKYCNDVFYFDSAPRTKTITLEILTLDKVGLLSRITNIISKNYFNILTINQSPPINKHSKITISIVMTDTTCNLSSLVEELQNIDFVKEVKIKSIEGGENA